MEDLDFFTRDQFDTLLANTKNKKHRVILLLLNDAGLRVTECCRMTWEDFDFRGRNVKIQSLKKRSKTPIKPRIVPMSIRLYQAIAEFAETEGKREGLCFATTPGKQPSRQSINRMLLRLEAKTPEVTHVHPHKLRHSFATNLRANGADILDIADSLGHEDSRTSRIYAHTPQEKLRALVNAPAQKLTLRQRIVSLFKPRQKRPLSLVVPDPRILVGRSSEVKAIETAIGKDISVVLLGPTGIGKTHLLENLEFSKPVIEIDSCAGFKKSIVAAIIFLSEGDRAAAVEMTWKETEPAKLIEKVSRESLPHLCETLCSIIPKNSYILKIGHVDDITPTVVRALEKLRETFIIVTTARKISTNLSTWAWDFDRIDVKPLPREEALRLFIRLTNHLEIQQPEYVKNKIYDTSEGNPRIVTELAERLGKEHEVTAEVMDELAANYIGRQVREIDMSIYLLLILGGFTILRYVGRETDESALQMIGGGIMIIMLFARFFFNSSRRVSL